MQRQASSLDGAYRNAHPPRYHLAHTTSAAPLRHRKAVIVAVPGAFTPTCSEKHVPDIIAGAERYREKGYTVYIIGQNDPFVSTMRSLCPLSFD